MNATPNLSLPHIESNQGQKEVTANTFAEGLDIAIAGSITIELDGKEEYILTTVEARHAILIFTGNLNTQPTVMIPTEFANKKFIVAHQCSGNFPLHIKHPNSQGIVLQSNQRCWIYSDGQEIYTLT